MKEKLLITFTLFTLILTLIASVLNLIKKIIDIKKMEGDKK